MKKVCLLISSRPPKVHAHLGGTVIYRFGVLRRDLTVEAENNNEMWLGPQTLGIEVTSRDLASRCGLGNIDPQHQRGGGSSAIEEALVCFLPEPGTRIVTIRPDKDSIGAMAVLELRASGRLGDIDKALVSWIGALDRHGYELANSLYPELAQYFDGSHEGDALNVVTLGSEPYPGMDDKVAVTMEILCRKVPQDELLRIKILRRVDRITFEAVMHGQVAFITAPGHLDGARNWGNKRYPVVAIFDPRHETHGGRSEKWTIVRRPRNFDRYGFEQDINFAEACARGVSVEELSQTGFTWGGTKNIVSSPQGVGRSSRLSQDEVLGLVRKHTESGKVT